MKIFISYRQVDTGPLADSIYYELKKMSHEVFLDVTSISPGRDFREEIERFIQGCDAVLAIIGPQWLTVRNESGTPRIEDKDDLLRLELELALASGTPVVPILPSSTRMPSSDDLPQGLKRLPRLHAHRVTPGSDPRGHVGELVKILEELIDEHERMRAKKPARLNYVLSVGGANGEYTISLPAGLQRGGKQAVTSDMLYGGSGFNYAAKLLGYGRTVLPILNVGNDALGREIRDQFLRMAADNKWSEHLLDWARTGSFFVAQAKTPLSTIIVEREERTILKEHVPTGQNFLAHLKQRLGALDSDSLRDGAQAVMIGHVEADRRDALRGECTRYLVDHFQDRCPVFANFGSSQLELGYEAWESYLPKLTVLQMNLSEVKRFFQGIEGCGDLWSILNKLSELPTFSVVTLDKFGAICVGQGAREFILAWPHEVEVLDSTGAGDAFMSGLVAELTKSGKGEVEPSLTQMLAAVNEARFWAAFACGHLGGAKDCPSEHDLDLFKSSLNSRPEVSRAPDVPSLDAERRLIWVLDRAYG